MGMFTVTFHGGKLNNKKKQLKDLRLEYINEYISSDRKTWNPLSDINYQENVYFSRMTEVYKLTKVGKLLGNKYITKIGYVKVGSKTKPDSVWNKGLFHSESIIYGYPNSEGLWVWKPC